jgi:hypothetical protein
MIFSHLIGDGYHLSILSPVSDISIYFHLLLFIYFLPSHGIFFPNHKCLNEDFKKTSTVGSDHIKLNTPYPVRSAKLSGFESDEYSGGGPPGKLVMLLPFCNFFFELDFFCKSFFEVVLCYTKLFFCINSYALSLKLSRMHLEYPLLHFSAWWCT